MTNERYTRNRLYLNDGDQKKIARTHIFLGGAGIGGIVAECALRIGFEDITVIDGDIIDESNLNRQNFCHSDIGKYKAETLAKRLLAINPKANIRYKNVFIDKGNLKGLVDGDIAVNALDFKDETPFLFDGICKERGIPVLHPYNFGWGGFLTIVKPDGIPLSFLSEEPKGFELKVAEYVVKYGNFWNVPKEWLKDVVAGFKADAGTLPPPQLSIGSWITAGLCVNAMVNMTTGKPVKFFPKFYLSSFMDDDN